MQEDLDADCSILGILIRPPAVHMLEASSTTLQSHSDTDDQNVYSVMAKSLVSKHYERVLSQWPVDALRPDVSFQKAMRMRIDRRLDPPSAKSEHNVVANEAQATVPTPPKFDEQKELVQVNVLYSFLENRYSQKYPLSERILKPASSPAYYDDLMKELREAPARSWLSRMINRWKGFIRFS